MRRLRRESPSIRGLYLGIMSPVELRGFVAGRLQRPDRHPPRQEEANMASRSPLIAGFLALAAVDCALALAAPEARPSDPTAEARLKLARKDYTKLFDKAVEDLANPPPNQALVEEELGRGSDPEGNPQAGGRFSSDQEGRPGSQEGRLGVPSGRLQGQCRILPPGGRVVAGSGEGRLNPAHLMECARPSGRGSVASG
jgi:hypothetical protein